MRLYSVSRCSLHIVGFSSSSSEIYIDNMKYAVFFLLCLVALAAAAPQFITTVGGVVPAITPFGTFGPRTLVAGPTVVDGFGSRLITPGYVGPAYF